MRLRIASINDARSRRQDRLFHWPLGRRPDDHPSLSDLGPLKAHPMDEPGRCFSSDVAFTPSVKAVQARKGSRAPMRGRGARRHGRPAITAELAAFIAAQTSAFLATANRYGQPYIQHRGGPPGFLRVLDDTTLGFADFAGNRQFITLGNLAENAQAHLFLIDYSTRRRIKIWGEARVVEGDDALIDGTDAAGLSGRASQAILFTVSAWDANCPQHIPLKIAAADVAPRWPSATIVFARSKRRSPICGRRRADLYCSVVRLAIARSNSFFARRHALR